MECISLSMEKIHQSKKVPELDLCMVQKSLDLNEAEYEILSIYLQVFDCF